MKAAIYCRVSTEDQNISQQKELLVRYCNEKSIQYKSYSDDAISGTINDRPEWNKLLKDCENGNYNKIIVTKWDRITRDLEYAIRFIKWISEQKEIHLISIYDGQLDLSPDKIFQFKLKCLLSEYELDLLRWRSKIGIERAKKEGKYKGGKKGRTWINNS